MKEWLNEKLIHSFICLFVWLVVWLVGCQIRFLCSVPGNKSKTETDQSYILKHNRKDKHLANNIQEYEVFSLEIHK